MEYERKVQRAKGKVWRWNEKRATGIIETVDGSHVWFGLDSLGEHKNFGDVVLNDQVEVEYEAVQQGSHDLRAVKVTWPLSLASTSKGLIRIAKVTPPPSRETC